MFNLKGRDPLQQPKEAPRAGLKPALYDPPGTAARPAIPAASQASPLHANPPRDVHLPPAALPHADPALGPWPAQGHVAAALHVTESSGTKLFVGVNIKLKGAEISDCDVLGIEGHVEATVHSKVMQIGKPGTLKGTALIDVAEIHGEFVGELTARTRLVVHGTGRVSGTIRYGQLIVSEGGEISGDVKPVDAADRPAQPARVSASDPRYRVPTA